MNNNKLITIFTATYNRGNLLQRLYESIKKQKFTSFEWVIIDDGSTDNTSKIISDIKKDAPFIIIYQKQKNQGKHVAINKGLKLANGRFFYIVDSDDRLPKKSLEIIALKAQIIQNNEDIAGVVGLKCYFNKSVVGSKKINKELICSQLKYRYHFKNTGDRAEVVKTDIFKKFLFPKFNDENFIPESIVWNRMAQKYKMLYFPVNVYECEYLNDGLSNNSINLRRKNPIGITTLYAELGGILEINNAVRIKAYINFWRFFFCLPLKYKKRQFYLLNNKLFAFFTFFIGLAFFIKDTTLKTQKK